MSDARDDTHGDRNPHTESAARAVMTHVLWSRAESADANDVAERAAAVLVREAAADQRPIGDTVRGALLGAIKAGADTGADRQAVARAAAIGALEAAGDIDEAAVELIKTIVITPCAGIRPIDPTMFAEGRRTP